MAEELQITNYRELESILKGINSFKGGHLYDIPRTVSTLTALPPYVREAMLARVGKDDPNYDKIVLDKWGRRTADTKQYAETPEVVFYRAALKAAEGLVKNDPSLNYEDTVKDIFGRFIKREMFPNTPYMANGGHKLLAEYVLKKLQNPDKSIKEDLEQEKGIREQLFACFVLGLFDNREDIFNTLKEAAEIQASVGGTGFNFSYLRPANEAIQKTGGITDGPVSFMSFYSMGLGNLINQGGKRDGANMFMLDYDHPDFIRFIYSKRQDGEISAANISGALDHEFWQAAKSDGEGRFYPLKNPHYNPKIRPHIEKHYTVDQLKRGIELTKLNKKAKASLLLAENGVDVLSPWLPEGLGEEYRVIGKVKDGTVYLDAKKVLRHIAYGAWSNGEPGVIVTGHINDANPTHPRHFKSFILEQKDPEAIELSKKIKEMHPSLSLEEAVDAYVSERDESGRFSNLPVGVGEIRATNPCGEKPLLDREACVLGHVNLETILERTDVDPSGYRISHEAFRKSIWLMYQILDNAIDQNEFTNPKIEKTQKSNRKIGMGFMGLANMLYRLELPYNSQEARNFVDNLLGFWEKESDRLSFEKGEKKGAFPNLKYSHHRNGRQKRNAIVRTLAPTGTTAFVAKTTGGMEPEYLLAYTRSTVQGTEIQIFNPVLEEKLKKYPIFREDSKAQTLLAYIKGKGNGSLQEFQITRDADESEESFKIRQQNLEKIKKIFVTTYDILPEDHIRMEAVVQQHVDDAISKTTNFRSNATVEDVEKAFMFAYDMKIKGITFYRDGTRKGQPLKVIGKEDKKEVLKVKGFIETLLQKLGEPRPKVRGTTEEISTPYGEAYLTLNTKKDPEEGRVEPYETFINIGRAGSDISAITEGFGRLLSLIFKAGIPIKKVIKQLKGIGGETQTGIGENRVRSLPDAIARGLEKILEEEGLNLEADENKSSGNLCPKCSKPLIMEEGCEKCPCGFSKC